MSFDAPYEPIYLLIIHRKWELFIKIWVDKIYILEIIAFASKPAECVQCRKI